MKEIGFWTFVILGLFLTIGGLVASHFYPLDFITNPAGVLGVILLVWAFIIKKREKKQQQ